LYLPDFSEAELSEMQWPIGELMNGRRERECGVNLEISSPLIDNLLSLSQLRT
jgi:hypothetical protein